MLFNVSGNNDTVAKTKFLHCLAELYNQEIEKKDSEQLMVCWALLGDVGEVMKKKKTINELDLKNFEKSLAYVMKNALLPFEEMELEAAFVLKSSLLYFFLSFRSSSFRLGIVGLC